MISAEFSLTITYELNLDNYIVSVHHAYDSALTLRNSIGHSAAVVLLQGIDDYTVMNQHVKDSLIFECRVLDSSADLSNLLDL